MKILLLCLLAFLVNGGVDHKRIVCLYAADPNTIGVNMNDSAFRAKYCIKPDDVSHLNLDGMKMVLPFMEQFIASEYAKFKGQ